MYENTSLVRKQWEYYQCQVESGYFVEYDEYNIEDNSHRELYEYAVDYFGLEDAIKIIDYSKAQGMLFNKRNLEYVYDWEEWKGDKHK